MSGQGGRWFRAAAARPTATGGASGMADEARARLLAECIDLCATGGPETLERLCGEHPDLAGEIRPAVRVLCELGAAGTPPEESGTTDPVPVPTIDRFRVLGRLGAGGMGVVYRARDPSLDRDVALKVLPASLAAFPDALERFRREGRALARIRHPGIVAVHEVGETRDGLSYFVMDLVEGGSLDVILQRLSSSGTALLRAEDLRPAGSQASGPEGATPRAGTYVEAVVRLIAKVAEALHQAHRAGVVHRDIKPGNILVDADGNPHLADFGLARGLDATGLTRTGVAAGTPYYMAPEHISAGRAPVGPRTDVYGLGVTLYEALTLRRPFEGATTAEVFRRILVKDPVRPRRLNPAISPDLETVCLKAIEKEPERRYSTAGEFAEDLGNLLALRPIRARPAGPVTRTVKLVRRNPWPAALAATVLLAVAGAGGSAVVRGVRVRAHVAAGEAARVKPDLERARSQAQAALEIDPKSALARGLLAAVARDDAARRVEDYLRFRESLKEVAKRVADARKEHGRLNRQIPTTSKTEAAQKDLEELERMRGVDARTYLQVLEALNRAEGLEARNPSVAEGFCGVYLEKWRDAVESGDEALAAFFLEKVRENDHGRAHAAELEGKGSIALAGSPDGAEVHLFRYVRQSTVKEGGEPRLVPVPFHPDRGLILPPVEEGPDQGSRGWYPGDFVFVVDRVEPGSPGERAGVRRGDYVLRLDGRAVGETVAVIGVEADGPADGAGVRPSDRLARVWMREDHEIRDLFDVGAALWGKDFSEDYEAFFTDGNVEKRARAHRGGGFEQDFGVRIRPPEGAVEGPVPPEGMRLWILSRDGEVRDAHLERGEASGLAVSATVSPLAFSPSNRVGTLPVTLSGVPPGSYLFVLRSEGREDVRLPVLLKHGDHLEVTAEMPVAGSGPEGFLWVAGGPFIAEGDLEAVAGGDRVTISVGGFWIARLEVTVGEYREFLDDPETLAEIDRAEKEGRTIRTPRYALVSGAGTFEWTRGADGTHIPAWAADEPIRGVSWADADAYCKWRSRRAERRGGPWVYEMPKQEEWEKAARGVDGRKFPWGDIFRSSFCRCAGPTPWWKSPGPAGWCVRGESPWGLLDMSGGVWEWCGGWAEEGSTHWRRGGGWQDGLIQDLRSAHRHAESSDYTLDRIGFRLVARPRGGS
jgi:formylglycine-generating enzyme required for sulfatase activity/tetratricopeptide (TPR) repeat protein